MWGANFYINLNFRSHKKYSEESKKEESHLHREQKILVYRRECLKKEDKSFSKSSSEYSELFDSFKNHNVNAKCNVNENKSTSTTKCDFEKQKPFQSSTESFGDKMERDDYQQVTSSLLSGQFQERQANSGFGLF